MRINLLLFGWLVCNIGLSQTSEDPSRIQQWADYYYVNKSYEKAVHYFERLGEKIPLTARRNYSKALAEMGQLQEAAEVLRPLVDSDFAEVKDYYYFASYLTNNKKLKEEYRRKALRIPIEEAIVPSDERFSPPHELRPLSLNGEGPEFGSHIIDYNNNKILIYTKQQSKKYTKGLSKKIRSDHPIFNLHRASWSTSDLEASEATAFPLGINSVFQDGPSAWDPIAKTLYLTRSVQKIDKQKPIQLALYATSLDPNKQKIPRALSLNVAGYSTLHPALGLADRRLYFASDRPGGYGGMDLYYAPILDNGKFGAAVNLGPDINTTADEVFPFVYQDRFLFFSSKKSGQSLSLKMAINTVDVRYQVLPLKDPFESKQDDFAFWVDDGLEYGFLSSNRPNGKGDDDLYVFRFTPKLSGVPDQYQYNPIDTLVVAEASVLKNDNDQMLSQDPLTALFSKEVQLVENVQHGSLKLNPNGSFLYKNLAPTEVIDSFSYRLHSKYGKSPLIKVLLNRSEAAMEAIPEQVKETFLPIFYTYDRSNLLVDYKDRVAAVVEAMNTHPEMIVEVSSYADCRGSREYNLKLSQERNQTIIEYVRARIDKKERIFGKGYGENTITGNDKADYLILGGTFQSKSNAQALEREFIDLGYKAQMHKTSEGTFRVVVGEANSYRAAKGLVQQIQKLGKASWIKKCDCCNQSEREHQLNRRTDFKIIKF